jgi:uncharacterized protein YkwD
MKKLLTILFVLSLNYAKAQSIDLSNQEKTIDSLIFDEINQYRIKNNIPKLAYSQAASCLSESHNNFMIKCNCITHIEIINNDTVCPKQRLEVLKSYNVENVELLGFVDKDVVEGKLINQHEILIKSDINFMKSLAILFVEEWKSSELHNKNLLDRKIKNGAAKIKISLEKEAISVNFIAFE